MPRRMNGEELQIWRAAYAAKFVQSNMPHEQRAGYAVDEANLAVFHLRKLRAESDGDSKSGIEIPTSLI